MTNGPTSKLGAESSRFTSDLSPSSLKLPSCASFVFQAVSSPHPHINPRMGQNLLWLIRWGQSGLAMWEITSVQWQEPRAPPGRQLSRKAQGANSDVQKEWLVKSITKYREKPGERDIFRQQFRQGGRTTLRASCVRVRVRVRNVHVYKCVCVFVCPMCVCAYVCVPNACVCVCAQCVRVHVRVRVPNVCLCVCTCVSMCARVYVCARCVCPMCACARVCMCPMCVHVPSVCVCPMCACAYVCACAYACIPLSPSCPLSLPSASLLVTTTWEDVQRASGGRHLEPSVLHQKDAGAHVPGQQLQCTRGWLSNRTFSPHALGRERVEPKMNVNQGARLKTS